MWGHFAPLFHLVDVFAVYAITLLGGRHVILPTFTAAEVLLAMGKTHMWHCGLKGMLVQEQMHCMQTCRLTEHSACMTFNDPTGSCALTV